MENHRQQRQRRRRCRRQRRRRRRQQRQRRQRRQRRRQLRQKKFRRVTSEKKKSQIGKEVEKTTEEIFKRNISSGVVRQGIDPMNTCKLVITFIYLPLQVLYIQLEPDPFE